MFKELMNLHETNNTNRNMNYDALRVYALLVVISFTILTLVNFNSEVTEFILSNSSFCKKEEAKYSAK